jgi:hypothetical protein
MYRLSLEIVKRSANEEGKTQPKSAIADLLDSDDEETM